MNLPCLRPIPLCSFNDSSFTITRFQIGSFSSFLPSSQSLRRRRSIGSSFPPSSQSLRKRSIGSFTISAGSRAIGSRQIPARDRVIDFGKYKGKMLGTLPSKYLKWVTKNLRAGDFEEWAKLADEVLFDPIYKDRIEWEFAQNLLNGDVPAGTENAVSELLEISSRFGWDNEDKLGWSKINFEMLGTSKGGRIPRICYSPNNKSIDKKDNAGVDSSEEEESEEEENNNSRERRRERIRLQRSKNESGSGSRLQHDSSMTETRGNYNTSSSSSSSSGISETPSRFPGRQSLLKKALSLGTRKSL